MNRIILGDCMEGMKGTPDKYYGLAVCDPEYGLGMGASLNVNSKVKFINKSWDTKIPNDEYFKEVIRVSENQIIWGGNYFPYLWKNGCKGFIIWNKLNHHDNRSDVEMAWTSFDKLAIYFEYMWDGNRYGTKGNIKGVGQPTIRIHPTQKPIALYDWIFKNYAEPGMKVLDSHGGSMSSVISAIRAGLTIDCYEIDKDYYLAGKKRVTDYFSQLNAFESQPQIEWKQ